MPSARFPHRRIATVLSWLAAFAAQQGEALACDDCPRRHISAFDFDVTVPRPASPAEMGGWYSLYFAGGAALTAAMADATAGCVSFYDGVLVHSGRSADTLSFGVASAHTAPGGAVGGTDYLLTGSISGQAGAYSAEVKLETACSRERVASATKAFTSAGQALETGTTLAVQGLSPIAGTIENFEKGRRDGDVMVARYVSDESIRLTPSKTRASIAEIVPVDIALTDCDGKALAGRTLKLVQSQYHGLVLNGSELGTFTAATAVTDADGKVQVMFKAGNLKGTAILRAYFLYELPTGCDAVAGGTAFIQIEDVPAKAYLLSARYTERSSSKMDSRAELDVPPVYSLEESHYLAKDERTINLWGTALNKGMEPGEVELATDFVSAGGTWNAVVKHDGYNYGSTIGKTGEAREFLQNTDVGIAIPEGSALVFYHNPADPGSNSFELTGSVFNRQLSASWYSSTEKGSGSNNTDTTETLIGHFSLSIPWNDQGAILRNDSGFSISLKHDTVWSETTGQVYHKTRSIELTAMVRPLSDLVSGIRGNRDRAGLGKPGATRLSRQLFDVLGRWSGTAKRKTAGVYLDGFPSR